MNNKIINSKPKITKAITNGIAKLNNYGSTNSLHQSFINTIKQLYISRDIRTLTTASKALDLLKSGDINNFYKRFGKLTSHIEIKINQNQKDRDERVKKLNKELVDIVDNIETKLYKLEHQLRTGRLQHHHPIFDFGENIKVLMKLGMQESIH